MVRPLLCGVGFRLLPALISASSSELSPVGDIMLKDLVPAHGRRITDWGQDYDPTILHLSLCSPQLQTRTGGALPGAEQELSRSQGTSGSCQATQKWALSPQPRWPHHSPSPTHGA